MNIIENRRAEYNENILTQNFRNNNGVAWIATNVISASMAEVSNFSPYEGTHCLLLTTTGGTIGETTFVPTVPAQYSFTAIKTGAHIFSVEMQLINQIPVEPKCSGSLIISNIADAGDFRSCAFYLGDNTDAGTFVYDKYETFFEVVELTAGDTYYIHGVLDQMDQGNLDNFAVLIDAMKVNFIGDRQQEIPPIYSLPDAKRDYKEISATETIYLENEVINITAGTFDLSLPAIPNNGFRKLKFVNSGTGYITLNPNGANTVNGISSYIVPVQTSVTLMANNDNNWVVVDKLRFQTLNRTEWIQSIGTTTINNGASLNLLTLISDANKSSNGTDGGFYELSVATNKILTKWGGVTQTHHLKIGFTITTGTDQHYNLTLRRFADNNILSSAKINRDADTGICTSDFLTYTYSAADPFVTGGFYIQLDNNSGASVNLVTSINLLSVTYFK